MLAQDGRSENLLAFITELFLEHGYLVVLIDGPGTTWASRPRATS